jgi:hypothetical protein
MEMIYFTLVAIGLYLVSDRILLQIETVRGKRLQNRSAVFFVIIVVFSVATFALIQAIFEDPAKVAAEKQTQIEKLQAPADVPISNIPE